MAFFATAEFFDRVDRSDGFVFFTRSATFLSESFWSFRSAESKYRIDRGGLFAFFARTDILLPDVCLELWPQWSKGDACARPAIAVRNPLWTRELTS
jgi:hypothetical protein